MGFWDSNFQCVRPNCTIYCIYVLTRNRTSFILICLLLELKKKQKKQCPFDPWPCPWAHFWGADKHPGFYVGSEIKHGSLWSGLIPSSCAHIGSLSVHTQLTGHTDARLNFHLCSPCPRSRIMLCACPAASPKSHSFISVPARGDLLLDLKSQGAGPAFLSPVLSATQKQTCMRHGASRVQGRLASLNLAI